MNSVMTMLQQCYNNVDGGGHDRNNVRALLLPRPSSHACCSAQRALQRAAGPLLLCGAGAAAGPQGRRSRAAGPPRAGDRPAPPRLVPRALLLDFPAHPPSPFPLHSTEGACAAPGDPRAPASCASPARSPRSSARRRLIRCAGALGGGEGADGGGAHALFRAGQGRLFFPPFPRRLSLLASASPSSPHRTTPDGCGRAARPFAQRLGWSASRRRLRCPCAPRRWRPFFSSSLLSRLLSAVSSWLAAPPSAGCPSPSPSPESTAVARPPAQRPLLPALHHPSHFFSPLPALSRPWPSGAPLSPIPTRRTSCATPWWHAHSASPSCA